MPTVVTRATGGCAKPVGILYIEPGLQVPDAGSTTSLAGTDLDAAFTADLLSACLAHERCGVQLYRSVAARTTDQSMRQQYEHFGEETMDHVRLLEDLIAAAGGDPQYVSPAARAAEKAGAGLVESTYMLTGSVDLTTAELAMLEAVMLAEAKDHANWELLSHLAGAMAPGEVRAQLEAVTSQVLVQEEQHHRWAQEVRTEMLFGLATGGARPPSAGGSRSRDELYAVATELDIDGRSQMTKDELAHAVAEQAGAAR